MLRFLQTLDRDTGLEGIQLPTDLFGALGEEGFNIDSDSFELWFNSLLASNGLSTQIVDEPTALAHFYNATTSYFQAPLTVGTFDDMILTWESREQIILKADKKFELLTYENETSEICTGTWAVSENKLDLQAVECDGSAVEVPKSYIIDFALIPAAGEYFRVKITEGVGDEASTHYAFTYLETFENITVPRAPTDLTIETIDHTTQETTFSWQDNSNRETKYIFQSSVSDTFVDDPMYTITKEYPMNTIQATDTPNVPGGMTVFFRVQATNLAGESAYSNIVSAQYAN